MKAHRTYVLRPNRPDIRVVCHQFIESLDHDRLWDIRIFPHEPKRSLDANAYYWGVVNQMIAQETGMSPEDIHEEMLSMFAPKVAGQKLDGTEVVRPQRSSAMNKREFSDFVNQCQAWAAEFLGVVIPDAA